MAGVSPAVVSYVLNGGPRPASKAARERVLAAVDTLGYRADVIASALRGGSSKTLGLLVPSPVNSYFAELAAAIQHEAFAQGNALIVGLADDGKLGGDDYLPALLDRRVDGVILISSRPLLGTSARWREVPVVVIDRAEDELQVSNIHIDDYTASKLAVEHLQSWGHRLIACVAGPHSAPLTAERTRGWQDQQYRIDAPNASDLVVHAPMSPEGGLDAAHQLLADDGPIVKNYGRRPTAIFVSSDAQAHGVLRACFDLGISVPTELSIVSFDGTVSARFTTPPLTTMGQPIQKLGESAVRLLLKHIADPSLPPQKVIVEGKLIHGSSCSVAAPEEVPSVDS